MTAEDPRRTRILRRDRDLARLVDGMSGTDAAPLVTDLIEWAVKRDAERRDIGNEALERYTELNLLYDLAERSTSLDPATVISVATSELARAVRRGTSVVLLTDEHGRTVRPMETGATETNAMETNATPVSLPTGGFAVGDGIIGGVAGGADGEIVNDPSRDSRAVASEAQLGALMVAPLRAGPRRRGVVLVVGDRGAEFTAGEFRLLSAVAALTAPVLDAALTHARTVALAREREAELQRQLDELRNEVGERRREERVTEITGSDYFRSLRQQADSLRSALDSGANGGES